MTKHYELRDSDLSLRVVFGEDSRERLFNKLIERLRPFGEWETKHLSKVGKVPVFTLIKTPHISFTPCDGIIIPFFEGDILYYTQD